MENWLAFHLCRGISNQTKFKIVEKFHYCIEKILDFVLKNNKKIDFKYANYLIDYCKNKNIKIISINNENYPETLKQIPDPPICLFYIGNLKILNKNNIAFVGTRRASAYGLNVTKLLIEQLSEFNINIVSGMALGIDTASHLAALNNNISTTAVLGCGIDIVYPSSNEKLYKNISKSGLILSEFPPFTKPKPYYFPIRNRIISGLSLGTVVIEAREKSGSMITARLALEQGKEVFCVPGRIFDKASSVTNEIIKKGEGKLITNASDILSELIDVDFYEKSDKVLKLEPTGLISHLLDSPKTIDELEFLTGKDRSSLILELTNLQLDEKIFKNAANQYSKR